VSMSTMGESLPHGPGRPARDADAADASVHSPQAGRPRRRPDPASSVGSRRFESRERADAARMLATRLIEDIPNGEQPDGRERRPRGHERSRDVHRASSGPWGIAARAIVQIPWPNGWRIHLV